MVVLLYVTFPDQAMAKAVASDLLDQRLIACANILSPMTSLYHFDGALETSSEVAVIVKTTSERALDARQAIANAHPYTCPCILQLPCSGGHEPFLEWIADAVL